MYGMTTFFGRDLALQRNSEEGYVADNVKDLVADELVVESERGFIEHAVGRKDYSVIQRPAKSKIGLSQHLDLVRKAERAGRRDLFAERAVIHHEMKGLPLDERMREVDHALDLESVGGLDRH